ncbi:MAG: hypothetical protein KDB40_23330 [Acidimicrobiales bacterium]|nr:hypothetical protein [Acidimicrobiales bacterium]MCB9396014.1 hypothetical protein [Acidimicrobiaceae bacterium]
MHLADGSPSHLPPDRAVDGREATRVEFAYEGWVGRLARLVGLGPSRTSVEVDDTTFTARFGPWIVTTAVGNVAGVEITGPYHGIRVVGVHVSLADRGLTFGTTARAGVCVRFHESVSGVEPTGRLRHPGLTVTVREPERLVAALVERRVSGADRQSGTEQVEQPNDDGAGPHQVQRSPA